MQLCDPISLLKKKLPTTMNPMTRKAFIQQVEIILRKRRDALRRCLSDDLSRLVADDCRGVCDPIDKAVDDEFQSLTCNMVEFESRELARVEHALNQIHAGEYGKCEQCQRSIPMARLRIIPSATTCVKCQEKSEAQLANSRLPADWRSRANDAEDWREPSLDLS
jgi:DnaK suppressor protein